MSRVRERRLFWEVPEGVSHSNVYVGDPTDSAFLANVDSGAMPVAHRTQGTEWVLGENTLDEGMYQFAVVTEDEAGNFGDPYQHPAWVNVPLDLTPPGAAFGGGFELL